MLDSQIPFLSWLREQEGKARLTDLSEERENALDYYNGEPFGDEEEGRSQLVTRDVAEVVDYMTVSLLRTMASGERVVEFEHEDREKAEEATEAVHRQFMRSQNGYRIIHDWIKAGLLEKTGWVKTFVEKRVERVERVVPEMMIPDDAIEAEPSGELDPMTGTALWRVVALEEQAPRICDVTVPNEELRYRLDACEADDLTYLAHVTRKTISQLREMGFDVPDDLTDEGDQWDELEAARNPRNWQRWGDDDYGPNREVWLLEEHVRYDLNGDGLSERLCVHRVGANILSVEEEDDSTLTDWCPFPMQHRLVGQSLADKVMDIQRIRSVVLRNTMDGFYFGINPRTYIDEGAIGDNTIDDLLTVRPGSIVRYKGQKPETQQNGFDPSSGLAMLEQFVGERESRTGITRLNQGLDADALNKTATGTALMQAQGQQIEEYLARNFAEAFARMMRKRYALMKRYMQPFTIVVDGDVRQIDPSQWPDDMEVVVRVGLGSGRKDQRLLYRTQLLDIQKEAMMAGAPIVTWEQIYNTCAGIIADANLGSVRDAFIDPETIKQANGGQMPTPPNPDMVRAQADMQMQSQKLQGEQEIAAARLTGEQQLAAAKLEGLRAETEAKLQLSREESAARLELEREKAAQQAVLAERQQAFEMQMAERQFELDSRLAERKAATAQSESDAKVKKFRDGGDLDK